MKNISILSILVFLIATTASAQIAKKDILIGGNFGFNSNNTSESSNSSSITFNPRIGYAIGNNSVLSAKFGYGYSRNKNETINVGSRAYNFSAGLSWKKYFPFNDKVGWYTDLYSTYNYGRSKSDDSSQLPNPFEWSSKGFSAGINPGIYFIPVQGLIIGADVGGLGYSYNKGHSSSSVSRNSGFSANFFNTFNFGVEFIINKKKK